MKSQKSKKSIISLTLITLWIFLEQAHAALIEPMGKALQALLKSTQVKRKQSEVNGNPVQVFYTKKGSSVGTAAFIEKGIYEPNCSHTWAIGIDGKTGRVTEVRVIELSCPHAFPTKAENYLGQYKGKGPADVAKLDAKIQTIAKATGSCRLVTQAVKRAIVGYAKLKSQL